MDYNEITDLVFEFVSKYNKQNDFKTASAEMKDIIYSMSKKEILPLINQIGIIPEKFRMIQKKKSFIQKSLRFFLENVLKNLVLQRIYS